MNAIRSSMSLVVFMLGLLALAACGGGGDSGSGGASSAAPTPPPEPTVELDAPSNVSLENNGPQMVLNWDPVDNAAGYNVYYAHEPLTDISNYGAFTGGNLILDAESPHEFTVDEIEPVYHIRVTATVGQVEGPPSAQVLGFPRYMEAGSDGQFVDDLVNGLRWNRCVLGQQWDKAQAVCVGESIRPDFASARTAARQDGAVVPPLRALMSITYCSNGLTVSGHKRYFFDVGSITLNPDSRTRSDRGLPDVWDSWANGDFRCGGGAEEPRVVEAFLPTPLAPESGATPNITILYWNTTMDLDCEFLGGEASRIRGYAFQRRGLGQSCVDTRDSGNALMARFVRRIPTD